MPATLLRLLRPDDVVCPAGSLVGDASVRCGIERHTLIGSVEPTAVEGLCCGEYTACSSWRAHKEVEARGGDISKILDAITDEGRRLRAAHKLREARRRAAMQLLVEDSPQGAAFRRRLGIAAPVDR